MPASNRGIFGPERQAASAGLVSTELAEVSRAGKPSTSFPLFHFGIGRLVNSPRAPVVSAIDAEIPLSVKRRFPMKAGDILWLQSSSGFIDFVIQFCGSAPGAIFYRLSEVIRQFEQ